MAYLLFKLLCLNPIIEVLLAPLLLFPLGIRVEPLLFYIRFKNELVQDVKYMHTWKYKRIRYLEEKESFKELLQKEYIESFKKAAKKMRNKSVFFVTNQWIVQNVLIPLETEGVLKFFPLETVEKVQAAEKLVFISTGYIYKHLFDIKFWRKIFRKERITKFLIKFI
ncbi:hypothetical protein [Thermoanaerobacter mathranii]|uniref:hypothetical protein n=1 Tax=Thermoanaerobacter mathranii TaxID=583357 RepID=UPI003D6B799B